MTRAVLRCAWYSVMRHPWRSLMTVAGIALAVFLFVFLEGLQAGVREATEGEAVRNRLIVFQRARFCPSTSRLPERYAGTIERIEGVAAVVPVQVLVNNCRATLDSVTFRGVPAKELTRLIGESGAGAEALAAFEGRRDAALIGRRLAARRGVRVGDPLTVGAVTATVVGFHDSPLAGDDNTAYTHLAFVQQTRGEQGLGRVTQIEVAAEPGADVAALAQAIDAQFATGDPPTVTRPQKAFVESAAAELLPLIRMSRGLGIAAVLLVVALTMNAMNLVISGRLRELAVQQTVGFTSAALFQQVVLETLLLSVAGGTAGVAMGMAALQFGQLGFGIEGVQIAFLATPGVLAAGIAVSVAAGLLAAAVPAVRAARMTIIAALREG